MIHTESVLPRRLSGMVASLWLSLALACAANGVNAAESKTLTPLAMIGFELIEENPDPPGQPHLFVMSQPAKCHRRRLAEKVVHIH